MFNEICLKYNIDKTKLNRNYYENPIKKGEKINKADLYYCFIELNLQLSECTEIFNITYSKLRETLKYYNIHKSPKLQQRNREKNCLKNMVL